jgi:hypothetical protein
MRRLLAMREEMRRRTMRMLRSSTSMVMMRTALWGKMGRARRPMTKRATVLVTMRHLVRMKRSLSPHPKMKMMMTSRYTLHPCQPERKAQDNKIIAYACKMLNSLGKMAVLRKTLPAKRVDTVCPILAQFRTY